MEDAIFKAALAGLLHDIGKFAQRAGEPGSRPWDAAAEQAYGYRHALHSADFAHTYVPPQWAGDLTGPARHHRPQTHHDRVIALASRLAAGEAADSDDRQPQQLRSIFGAVTPPGEAAPPSPQYLPLQPLRIAEAVIFPGPAMNEAETEAAYKTLWRDFTSRAGTLRSVQTGSQADETTYLNSLLHLLRRYTWAIPAAYYQDRPDVSLYDHSRITAALAACLITRPEAEIELLLAQPETAAPVALLVGGDISGVQKFIYTITSKGATSGLRGRSMYLQLLTEVTARYVLDTLGLPLTNLIYAGGGHFYLLASAGSEAIVSEARRAIARTLLQHHQGDLSLALETLPLPAGSFHGPALSGRWRDLTQALQEAKQRQFADLDRETLLKLFAPQEHGGNEEKMCAVTQREHPGTQKLEGETAAKSPPTRSYEALGDELRRAVFIGLEQRLPAVLQTDGPEGTYQQILALFGYQVHFYQSVEEIENPTPGTIRRSLLALRDSGVDEVQPGPRQTTGRHLLVNVTPLLTGAEYRELVAQGLDKRDLPDPDSVKPFQVMAHQAQGVKRLGILRMDVDNLGKIFSEGLGEQATLSRIAALSFGMSLFFEGWAGEIARSLAEPGRELIYSIYSGGDDLFFVGAWHLMPHLAGRINTDLSRYTGGHPGIHTSGGITLVPEKYPLYQAADDALEAEKAAKANRFEGKSKNALHFLGKTIPWSRFTRVKQYQEDLLALVTPDDEGQAGSRSLLHRLSQLYLMYEEARPAQAEGAQVYWGPGQWRSAYSLSRLANQHKREVRTKITAIRDELSLENFTNIEWMGPAARWTELLLR